MSIRKAVFGIAAAAIAGLGALGAVGTGVAHAATPSCGHDCINPYTREWGRGEILTALNGGLGTKDQKLVLGRATNNNKGQDFTFDFDGPVTELIGLGLVSPAVIVHYANDEAFEIEYTPLGDEDTNLCVGTMSTTPGAGNILRLEPCGVSANTIWIANPAKGTGGFVNLIAGTTTNFSHPLVWTYPSASTPFDNPRPSITVQRLAVNSRGFTPNEQQWNVRVGVIK